MDTFLEALGHISEIVAILAQIKAAEKAGVGQVALPPIYVHHHSSTWTITGQAVRTTEPGKPPKPVAP